MTYTNYEIAKTYENKTGWRKVDFQIRFILNMVSDRRFSGDTLDSNTVMLFYGVSGPVMIWVKLTLTNTNE